MSRPRSAASNISTDPGPAYQLRRYGWSAKLALSVLTDFEELAVYDCTIRPKQSDKASHARVLYFGYQEYPDRWRELWDIFSREAVWSGAFDNYAASKRKRGTSEVDEEFLKEIEGWRDVLARNIALRNKDISSDDLNAAVQSTIDRVVFLRMAEDRRLEPSEQLLKLCERDDIYARFMRDLCRKADDKYNSGLFHFHKEQETGDDPDRITPKLTVDDRVFRPILQSLYFAHGSPYQFDLMPVEILGTIYERFLGKVIRLTAGHQAKVEKKPELRKSGGVYYTPSYIVDYCVRNTVGRKIKDRSPMQLAGLRNGRQPLRILDMACGSGSFLFGAYQCLLDHCLKWYIEHKPEKHKKAVYKDPRDGHWRLTIAEKKRILTTHIFGVDIDAQAVEVTKLSLLLKVLEGETDQTVSEQQRLFNDRALPNLYDNIKCGNSLIGSDYFSSRLIHAPDEIRRINPFDWKQGFPDAMKAGGFDCIIGNPPYIQLSMAAFRDEAINGYLRETFGFSGGRLNTFAFFIDRARQLTREGGRFAYIVPNTVLSQEYYEDLRRRLIQETEINTVATPQGMVFKDAVVETVILVLTNPTRPRSREARGKVEFVALGENGLTTRSISVSQCELTDNYKSAFIAPLNRGVRTIGKKLKTRNTLGEWLNVNQAIALKHDRSACLTEPQRTARHREILDGRHIGHISPASHPAISSSILPKFTVAGGKTSSSCPRKFSSAGLAIV